MVFPCGDLIFMRNRKRKVNNIMEFKIKSPNDCPFRGNDREGEGRGR